MCGLVVSTSEWEARSSPCHKNQQGRHQAMDTSCRRCVSNFSYRSTCFRPPHLLMRRHSNIPLDVLTTRLQTDLCSTKRPPLAASRPTYINTLPGPPDAPRHQTTYMLVWPLSRTWPQSLRRRARKRRHILHARELQATGTRGNAHASGCVVGPCHVCCDYGHSDECCD